MDGNGLNIPRELEPSSEVDAPAPVISIEQLQRLVQALDRSDVSELELNALPRVYTWCCVKSKRQRQTINPVMREL